MWKQNERILTLSTADITCDNVNNPRMEEEVLCEHSSYQGSMGVGPSGLFLHISKKSLIQQIYRILIVCRGSCLIPDLSRWIIHRRGSGCSQQRKVTSYETDYFTFYLLVQVTMRTQFRAGLKSQRKSQAGSNPQRSQPRVG